MSDPALFFSKFLLLAGLVAFVGSVMRVLLLDLWGIRQESSAESFIIEVESGSSMVLGPAEVPLRDQVLVGRGSECALQIKDPEASAQHARFTLRDDGVWLEDLNSSNGTVLDGREVKEPVKVRLGQTVSLGEVRLQLKKKVG